jgi:CelD/BcsL family acetyltransferase involved in cellulose biosynthesis
LRTATLTTRAELEALAGEWDQLLEQTDNVLPFYLHDWQMSWWDHLRQDQISVRDSLRVATVRTEDGALIAILPLMLTERPAVGPVRACMLQSLGADQNITELKGVIVHPRYEAAAARALVRHWEADPKWDCMSWSGLARGSAFANALESAMDLDWTSAWPHYVLTLPASWDAFRKTLKRNIRESLRHGYNSLKRNGLTIRFDAGADPVASARALPDFFRLHSLRARAKNAVPHADRFASRSARAFLESVVARLSAKGIAKVFTLTVGGAVVAARIGFVVRGSLYLYYSGYDPAFAKYGVMTTTVAEALKWAIEQGVTSADLSVGTDVSKTRWGPRELVLADAMSVRDSRRARTVFAAYQLAVGARERSSFGLVASFLLGKRSWE